MTPPVAKVTPAQNPQPPVTPATQPATPTATAPATVTTAPATTAPEPTTPKPAEAPPKPEVAPKPEPRARTAAAKVGQLMVSANVSGARISVDGQSDPSWLTPYTIPDLPAGAHNIVISMDGYENFQQSVTIEGGQTSNVVGNLSTPRAELDIVTMPPGVEVLIDGKSYGPSPVHATLPPGNHTYTVKPPGAAPYENSRHAQERGYRHQEANPWRGCEPQGLWKSGPFRPAPRCWRMDRPSVGRLPRLFDCPLGLIRWSYRYPDTGRFNSKLRSQKMRPPPLILTLTSQ